jgi:hypothetical protein
MNAEFETLGVRRSVPLPVWARAAILAMTWSSFAYVITFKVPQLAGPLARLEAMMQLPILTRLVLWFTEVNRDGFALPLLAGFAVLVVTDWAVGERVCRTGGSQAWYWIWFATACIGGGVAFLAVLAAMMAPVFMM